MTHEPLRRRIASIELILSRHASSGEQLPAPHDDASVGGPTAIASYLLFLCACAVTHLDEDDAIKGMMHVVFIEGAMWARGLVTFAELTGLGGIGGG